MRVQLSWLQDFVDLPDLAALDACLVEAGLTVDQRLDPTAQVAGVVVVGIVEVAPHPRADRLRVVTVDDGARTWQVVCGAANVAVGACAAHAQPGARLPGGLELGVRPLRGVESFGMLCARGELGLPEDGEDGIWLLPADLPRGTPALAHAPSPAVWTLSVTPNRPDLLSYLGVAREVAAGAGRRLRHAKARAPEKGPDIGTLARFSVEEPSVCRRYLARVVRHLKVGPSPKHVQERLLAQGVRAINNVVDATAWVMFEQGVPLHAYDLARLGRDGATPHLTVRRARAGEVLEAIDGGALRLTPEDLVVAGPEAPVALAGIVGGRPTAVAADTQDILLEAAVVEPTWVRASSRRQGVRTESSIRGERGVDPSQAQRALDRACQLVVEWAGGDVAKGVLEHAPVAPRVEVALRPARVAKILGVQLAPEAIVQLLEPLAVRCLTRTEQALIFEVPPFRPDISREVDLVEEVARRHGLGRLPTARPAAGGPASAAPPAAHPRREVRQALLAAGLSECVTFAFGPPSWYGGDALTLLNPLGAARGVMRTSLLPGLLAALATNLRRGRRDLRLFELGTTFHPRPAAADLCGRERLLPLEVERVAWSMVGGRWAGGWWERGERVDLVDLLGVAETLVAAARPASPLRAVPRRLDGFLDGQAAELWVGDALLGVAGALEPELARRAGLEGEVVAGEISLATLALLPRASGRVPALSQQPSIRRDVAWLAPRECSSAALADALWAEAGGTLGPEVVEAVRLFDRYQGPPVPAGQVSLAYQVLYRHPERTLTDEEISTAFEAAIAAIGRRFSVRQRGP